MLKVGITGGIGSGKSIICRLFEMQKIPVFYADEQARALMHLDIALVNSIKHAFGEAIYSSEGLLNKAKLAALVFNDLEQLNKLNSLVHPAVLRAFQLWAAEQTAPYVIKEAALLFESKSYKDCDFTILVKSPLTLKIDRIIKRDSINESDVLKRMDKQLSDEDKEKLSDFILVNDENRLLIPQVLSLHDRFTKESALRK